MSINELTDIYNGNKVELIENAEFFFISNDRGIPFWNNKVFTFYFFKISNKLYIHNFEFIDLIKGVFLKDEINDSSHLDILNNKNCTILELDKVIFMKIIHTNAGHALGNILNIIYEINLLNLHDYKIIVPNDLEKFSNFLMSVIYTFFNKSDVIIINDSTIVKFNKSYVIKDFSGKKDVTTDMLIQKLESSKLYCTNIPNYDKIFLIKSNLTQNQNPTKAFSNDYNNIIRDNGFTCIIPENYDVNTLYKILNNSKYIVLSWGCCSYLNSIFINSFANVLVLCNETYLNEYEQLNDSIIVNTDWFPKVCNKKLILRNLPCQLDDYNKQLLIMKLNELLE